MEKLCTHGCVGLDEGWAQPYAGAMDGIRPDFTLCLLLDVSVSTE